LLLALFVVISRDLVELNLRENNISSFSLDEALCWEDIGWANIVGFDNLSDNVCALHTR
jgi:hypothetical protein